MGPLVRASSTALLALCLMSVACQSKKPVITKDSADSPEALPTTSLQVPTDQLSRVEITQPGGPTVTLSRSSGTWTTVSPLPFLANKPAVESIVAVLAEIEIIRRVADRPEPKHRLTADSGVVVQAWTKDGALQPFNVGAQAGEQTYVQRVGEETVYAVRGKCRRLFDLSFEQLRDPTITKLAVTDIERVTYANQFGDLDLVAAPKNAGRFVEATPSIRNFDSERASKNVAVLSELFAKSYVDPPIDKAATGLFGPDTARAEVSIRGENENLTVYVGRRTKNGRLHLRTSASDQIYLVSAHLSSSLIPQRKQLERSDDEMQEIREQAQAPEVSARTEAPDETAEHKHGSTLPTQVPPKIMGELRDLAQQQRD
jgi:hypothetical protein